MKHIECPIKLASASVKFPNSQLFNTNKARNQILFRIYGHFIFGFTQQSPKDYYSKYSIQVEGRLLDKIQEWAEYMRYQNLPKVKLNIQDQNENPIIKYFFPDDDNIGWIYNDQNIHLNIISTNLISGVCIDRSKNLEKKNYSMIQEKTNFTYKFSAKHIPEAPPSQTFMQHQIEFISNRFPQLEGNLEDGYRRHVLQIETLAGRKWQLFRRKSTFNLMNYYKNDKRHQSQPSLWSLNQPQLKIKSIPKINHKRLVLPVIPQNPGVGYYSPNLQSIYSNPKVTRLRSVTKIPTLHDVSNEKINIQKSHKKYSQKFTILEMLLKEVDEEVDQDMRDNPKCVRTPLQLQPLNDNFIEQLKHIKANLQKVLRKKL